MWKAQMTPQQILTYEAIAKNSLQYHNYELINSESKLSVAKAFGYKLHHQLVYIKHMFVMNVIDGFKIKFLGKKPFDE